MYLECKVFLLSPCVLISLYGSAFLVYGNPFLRLQITPTGPVVHAQPDDYGVPQFLEALQNRQNVAALGSLGTPHLAVFSGADPPFPKGEATYNQWAFKVCSLQSQYWEDILWDGII